MSGTTHDFDLHGIVGVRLLGAAPTDVATVSRQLGLPCTDLDRDPHITIEFVDVATRAPLTHVGVGDTGFNRDGFFVLGAGGSAGRTRFPFDAAGGPLTLVCERGLAAVPHLVALVNLAALGDGVLPLHASAFTTQGRGVLVMGWSKGGKTESLLAAMQHGAQYVGDEWVYLLADGTMLGLPEPLRLWDWHLEQLDELRRSRSGRERARLAAWRTVSGAARVAANSPLPGADLARRVLPLARRQANLRVSPEVLFGPERVSPRGRLDSTVLVLSHAGAEFTEELAEPRELSGRMSASLAEERAAFMSHYRQFRFAFPHRRNPLVESAEERESALLAARFDHRPCVKVSHPHPCDIAALGAAVLQAAHRVEDMPSPALLPAQATS